MAIEPSKGVDAKFLSIGVRAFGDLQSDVLFHAIKLVDRTYFGIDIDDTVQRKNRVFVGVRNQQRAWCDQCGDHRIIPAIGVDHVHAIAMALDTTIDDMILERCDTSHRDGGLHTFVQRSDVP